MRALDSHEKLWKHCYEGYIGYPYTNVKQQSLQETDHLKFETLSSQNSNLHGIKNRKILLTTSKLPLDTLLKYSQYPWRTEI